MFINENLTVNVTIGFGNIVKNHTISIAVNIFIITFSGSAAQRGL
jgi:hypothetical protein